MSDEKPKTVDDLGVLSNDIYFTTGGGTGEYLGHELTLGVTAGASEPIIYANHQSFRLRWEDIIWIAAQRGLFEKGEK